eukprot:c22221_g1_i1 orf=241-1905(-)
MESNKREALDETCGAGVLNNTACEVKVKKLITGKYVIACTVIATVTSTLLGYDIGIISGAILFIQKDLNLTTVQVEFVVGSLNLIAIVGGFLSGWLSDLIGRRKTMAIASVIFFVGAVVMSVAPSFEVLMIGRLTAGVGVGFGLMIAPVYSAELSPAKIRGSLVSLIEIFINFGILLGYVVSFAFEGLPTHINWRVMLGLGAIPSILLAVGVIMMPESPRWLVTQKRIVEAKEILMKTSDGDKEEANLRLQEIMEAAGFTYVNPNIEPTADELAAAFSERKKQGEGVWRELFWPTPAVRRMLIVALSIHFFQQASGIDAMVYYSPVIFSEAGIKSKLGRLGATVGVGFTKFIFIFFATIYLDKVGRRPLLMISSAGISACLVSVAIAFITLHINNTHGDTLISVNVHQSTKTSTAGAVITIFAICSFVAFFSIGFGPVAWVYISEIFPLRVRAQAVGLGVIVNRLVSGTVSLTFLSLSKAITPAVVFFIFASIGAASFVFVYFMVPETKGKTLEELEKFFGAKDWAGHLTPAKRMNDKTENSEQQHTIEMQSSH